MSIMGVIYATLILQHFFCTYIEIFYTPTSHKDEGNQFFS